MNGYSLQNFPYWLKQSCKLLDPKFPIPSEDDLKNRILPKAISLSEVENATEEILPVLYVKPIIIEKNNEKRVFILVLGLNNNVEYYYVNHSIYNYSQNVTALIETVCDQVVANVYVKYKTKIFTTIIEYDSWFTERSVVKVGQTEIIYFRSKSLLFLVEDLKTDKENINTELLAEQPHLITVYMRTLKTLSEVLKKCLNVSEVVQEVLSYLAKEENHVLNRDAGFTVVSYMSPFYLGCNFVDFRCVKIHV